MGSESGMGLVLNSVGNAWILQSMTSNGPAVDVPALESSSLPVESKPLDMVPLDEIAEVEDEETIRE